MSRIPDQDTDRIGWLKWRKGGIGGSDAAAILGESKYTSPLDVFIDKTTEHVSEVSSLACQRGTALEPIVAARYAEETGKVIRRQQSRIHPEYDFIRCSMDYQIFADEAQPTGMLECKTANSYIFNNMKLNGIHNAYWIQCQHNMMVCGYTWGAIAVLQPDSWEFLHFQIPRDDEFCATLLQRELDFWQMVKSGTPPEMAEPAPVRMPAVGGSLVQAEGLDHELATQFRDLTQALTVAVDIKAEADALHEQSKKVVQTWMLANRIDVIEGQGKRIYYKEQAGRKSLDKKALAADHPEIDLSKYEKSGAPFRSFRVFDRPVEQDKKELT